MTDIAELFSARVPRYTSYPTAPHFHSGVTEANYRAWLADLPADMPLSLYLHIPFCDSMCWFCGCHTKVVNHYGPVRAYCDLLIAEMELVAGALSRRQPLRHIHWGGGSPDLLKPDDIARLSGRIRDLFAVAPDAEFAVEIDPRGFSAAAASCFAAAGATRASIGLQDCDEKVQKAINRIQSRAETIAAVQHLRGAGIAAVNVDILYGLPHQTLKSWKETLDFAVSLEADRLAVFGYAHMPGFKKHMALIDDAALPGLETRYQMAELAGQVLRAAGYVAVGLDHFAKPGDAMARAASAGTLMRNFQGYTVDSAPALIGLGASAIGALPQGYIQNQPLVPAYRDTIQKGRLPVARGVVLTDEDRARREIIERLMCDLTVDLNPIARKYKVPAILTEAEGALRDQLAQGIVSLDGGKVTVPEDWRPAVRLVCAAFDRYLPSGAARHSLSV